MIPEQTDPNSHHPMLHLPRLLCLHGGGTNARIFQAQCRVLERALQSKFRLCFAQAPFPSEPGPDVTSVYGSYGPFFTWLRWRPEDAEMTSSHVVEEVKEALENAIAADDAQGATGEWVGLFGFSQGAKICASLLLSQQIRNEQYGLQSILGMSFRFAVLLAGRGPLVSLGPETIETAGVVDAASPAVTTYPTEHSSAAIESLIRLPTVHVHGLEDTGLFLHRQMLQYFDQRHTRVVEWDGTHRVPIATKDVAAVVDGIFAVAKATGVEGV